MNEETRRRLTFQSVLGTPAQKRVAKKKLETALKNAIANLMNEREAMRTLTRGLPPARALTRAEITNLVGGANALLKVAGKNNGSYYKNGRRYFPQ